MKTRTFLTLAACLAFNAGAFAASGDVWQDEPDPALAKPANTESFGARMAKARAAKHKGPKAPKTPKAHKAKVNKSHTAKAPRTPKADDAGGF